MSHFKVNTITRLVDAKCELDFAQLDVEVLWEIYTLGLPSAPTLKGMATCAIKLLTTH